MLQAQSWQVGFRQSRRSYSLTAVVGPNMLPPAKYAPNDRLHFSPSCIRTLAKLTVLQVDSYSDGGLTYANWNRRGDRCASSYRCRFSITGSGRNENYAQKR